ncbi:glutathione-independent formaldehyde dehydrogenase [Paraburkholderia sp. BL6665CI2N2]|uniref:alcohol dehydrogenase catalytic domain-containing protein n=1 Tax=Paraburkholderia sp. BL6665CI2N2 TaxID=1938806 RepID=UPI0010EB7275|nr:alcohol dehydrogenase catalytic domain-containing protein [Paraburkholderia sp. BL6665CI2N2]TDY22238.1 glutathione-independent formaldehyde dehydrogenase [Paraburkholderia sp. BL6665CI2N2]
MAASGNRVVTFMGPMKMELQTFDYPKLVTPTGKKANHGAILKIVTTNICGSDQHIYHGRFAAPKGMVMGHEMTGEVIEVGPDVEFIKVGDICSVPFNVSCGRCRNCKERHTDVCMNVNDTVDCGAYGFNLGGWQGGQSDYLMVPYADWNLLSFPDKDQAMEKIRDLTLLSDILPTGFHGLMEAGAKVGSTVYIAGAGPVGRCAAAGARLIGASCIIVADTNRARLDLLKNNGCEVVDLTSDTPVPDQIEAILGKREVDCGVDCVGLEAHGSGPEANSEHSEAVINTLIEVVRAGGAMGIPGIYTDADPKASTDLTKKGKLPIDFGKAWIKSPKLTAGQAPIMHYNRDLMMAILWDRMPYLGAMLNTEIITLEQAPDAYKTFSDGSPKKFVIDPHGSVKKAA